MTKKKTKRPKPEVGQTVYVTISSILGSGEGSKIYEYIVTKVNTASFYAHNKDGDLVRRFDLKSFTHKGTFEYHYAYLTKEEILKSRAIIKERTELKHHINNSLKKHIPLSTLRAIKEIIDNHMVKW